MKTTSSGRLPVVLLMFFTVRFLSQAGQALFFAALLILAGTGETGPLNISGMFAATLTAAILFGLPGGALADRLRPGRGFLLGVLLRLVVISAVLPLAGTRTGLVAVAFVYSAVSQIYSPAEMALVIVFQRHTPARGHLFLAGLQYAGQGVAMLLLAPLLLFGGVWLVVWAAIGAYVALIVPAMVVARSLPSGHDGRRQRAHPALALRETFTFFRREHRAVFATALLGFTDTALRGVLIAVPRLLSHELDLGRTSMVVVLGCGAAGVAGGMFWVSRVVTVRSARLMRVLLGTAGAVLVSLGLVRLLLVVPGVSAPVFMPAAAIVLGFCFSVAPVVARTVLSVTAPPGLQARVFATQATVAHAAVVVPVLLTGAATQFAGPGATLAVLGACGLLLLAAMGYLGRRGIMATATDGGMA